jgi:hypothetical protein
MRIAVSGRRSAKCELYGLFLTGRRGYSRERPAVPYALQLRPRNT